jgi:hypothetical protein
MVGPWDSRPLGRDYFSFAYSAFACFRAGMSGSASFQRLRNTRHVLRFGFLKEHNIGIRVSADQTQLAAIERPMKVPDLLSLKVGDLLPRRTVERLEPEVF